MVGPRLNNLKCTILAFNATNLLTVAVFQADIAAIFILWIVTQFFMLRTAIGDPGILPKQPKIEVENKRKLLYTGS